MFYSRITAFSPVARPLDFSTMSVEELNFEGAHFQHIVDRNNMLRLQRIRADNAAALRSHERRHGSRSRFG